MITFAMPSTLVYEETQGWELWRDYIIYVEKTSEAGLLNFDQFRPVVREESSCKEVQG